MKVAIIGGGAAGCFAAANIGHAEVFILEKSARLLQKVRISGGGRCNVTHQCNEVSELVKNYPRGKNLLKKSLHHFTPSHTVQWFEHRGVSIKVEADGRMFPVSNSSESIINCLVSAMNRNGVKIHYQVGVVGIVKNDVGYTITTNAGAQHYADVVVISTGGYAKESQYQWLQSLGHQIVPPVPSLFTFNIPQDDVVQLQGIAVKNAVVKIAGTKLKSDGPVLITHWGISGPGVLKLSALAARHLALANYACEVLINWLPQESESSVLAMLQTKRTEHGKELIAKDNPYHLPKRLWEYFLGKCGIVAGTNYGTLTAKQQYALATLLTAHSLKMQGKTTFKEEFVACGGIDIKEVNPHTMESLSNAGMYFVGEVLDVDGITGGFNFQHAWSSAWLAAQDITAKASAATLLKP